MMDALQIAGLSYIDLLAGLSESNRPPGGVDSIRRMIIAAHLRPGLRMLHAGCNAGFLSRELVRRSGVAVTGADISFSMVRSAQVRAEAEGLRDSLDYVQCDMRSLPFDSGSFDTVVSAGALAFVSSNKESAVAEWVRVVKPNGLIADCELYYEREPPAELRARLGEVLGVEVPAYDLGYWLKLLSRPGLERYYMHLGDASLAVNKSAIEDYARQMTDRFAYPLTPDGHEALRRRLYETFALFNENMSYLNYVLLVYTARPEGFEPALFV